MSFADRVDHHLADREPAGADHRRAAQERRVRRDAAPHVDARPARRPFAGIELPAHDRMDAVAGDGDPGLDIGQRCAVGRESARRTRSSSAASIDADAGMAGDHPVGAEPLAHRGEQHRLQVAAMDRAAARRGRQNSRGLGMNWPKAIENALSRVTTAARLRNGVEDAERSQLGGRVRQHVDADAERQDSAPIRRRSRGCQRDARRGRASGPPMPAPMMATSARAKRVRPGGVRHCVDDTQPHCALDCRREETARLHLCQAGGNRVTALSSSFRRPA